jgi:acetolactate synthase I/II/III large subunit
MAASQWQLGAAEGTVHAPQSREWVELPEGDVGDAVIAALESGGVDHLFFTSGSEIGFFQEAIAKARAHRNTAPRLITMTHEHASLNAALGYAAVSGRMAATAAHVDVGTQHYGGAVHTARHSGLPVLITAGAPPTSYPGTIRGARDGGGHIWMQQSYDQHGIVRQYVKWDHRLECQDNPGLIVSRALQVAQTEPKGPVYISFPCEVALMRCLETRFPTAGQLGIPRPPGPDPAAINEIARRLVRARNPMMVAGRSGRNPRTVAALVMLCELLGMPVIDALPRAYLCFPMTHPLYLGRASLKDADMVVALEADVPWMPGPSAPPESAYVAVVDVDAAKARIPTYEFTADLRMTADSFLAIEALAAAVRPLITAADRSRFEERGAFWRAHTAKLREERDRDATALAGRNPIHPRFLHREIGRVLGDDCIIFDETIGRDPLSHYLRCNRSGSYFYLPASAGGWSPGAAFGAKLAAPERDIVSITGDGFYMFATANAALWSAAHYRAPFMSIIYQNRSYSTGVLRIDGLFPGGYAAQAGYDGGYFDPPIDFAKEAEAAGAYGENVRDPAEIAPAIERGLAQIRAGKPAVIAVWLPRLLQKD